MPIPPPTRSGRVDVEPEAVPERAEDRDASRPARARTSACVPGPIGSIRNAELAGRREAEATSAAAAAGPAPRA